MHTKDGVEIYRKILLTNLNHKMLEFEIMIILNKILGHKFDRLIHGLIKRYVIYEKRVI